MGKGPPHVGFPESSLRKYADKLVAMGYKVGVVEQMETPAELEERNKLRPKGQKKESAVRREMCEVRTLGTNPESEKAQATYLLSVTEDAAPPGQEVDGPSLAAGGPHECGRPLL